jgi:hypothetical protein
MSSAATCSGPPRPCAQRKTAEALSAAHFDNSRHAPTRLPQSAAPSQSCLPTQPNRNNAHRLRAVQFNWLYPECSGPPTPARASIAQSSPSPSDSSASRSTPDTTLCVRLSSPYALVSTPFEVRNRRKMVQIGGKTREMQRSAKPSRRADRASAEAATVSDSRVMGFDDTRRNSCENGRSERWHPEKLSISREGGAVIQGVGIGAESGHFRDRLGRFWGRNPTNLGPNRVRGISINSVG